MTEPAERIEAWLLRQPGWVRAATICEEFGVHERHLRDDKVPGLMTNFAVSSSKGYLHVANASWDEYRKWKHARLSVGVKNFRIVRAMDKKRHNVLVDARPRFEVDSRQGVLAI